MYIAIILTFLSKNEKITKLWIVCMENAYKIHHTFSNEFSSKNIPVL